jgi:DeoR family fructose operon transcriptional repressor
LREQLDGAGSITIADAANALRVSPMTIRRDFAELEDRGVARRMRGGARAVGPETVARRQTTAVRAKARIATKLLELLPAAGTAAFDASTTVLRLAGSLATARDLTVLTNGPDTFAALQDRPGVTALLTGGELDKRTGSLVGPLACRTATQVLVDVLVLSAAAVDERTGALEATLDEAEVKRALATVAGQVVLAIDASKLGHRAPAVGVEWDRIDVLVTELDPADSRLDPYRSLADVR